MLVLAASESRRGRDLSMRLGRWRLRSGMRSLVRTLRRVPAWWRWAVIHHARGSAM